ncbi:glycosyltransferase family 9 protein [Bradyrhizobium diazoefficiens]|uniref:glycosyltransferase family 9 protein n=1 Tax=Bradyrhizobium diazoefficiens TaxID=1355477 RepID=UPI003470CF51
MEATALVHLASGVGNIVLATPMLVALSRGGFTIDLLVDGDYRDTADLFHGWSALRRLYNGAAGEEPMPHYDVRIPAIPPFYWSRYAARYRTLSGAVARPPDSLFFQNEQAYYLKFARQLGCAVSPAPACFLPISPDRTFGITSATLVLAPGCKTGVMAAKRWAYFPELAEDFDDVAIVGVEDDLRQFGGAPMRFPAHVRSLVGKLSLRETASVMAAAGAVVANDSGLGHVAAAVGTPTVLLFGPTSHEVLGGFPRNVIVLRAGLLCEPCWHSARFAACSQRIDCLAGIAIDRVASVIGEYLPS